MFFIIFTIVVLAGLLVLLWNSIKQDGTFLLFPVLAIGIMFALAIGIDAGGPRLTEKETTIQVFSLEPDSNKFVLGVDPEHNYYYVSTDYKNGSKQILQIKGTGLLIDSPRDKAVFYKIEGRNKFSWWYIGLYGWSNKSLILTLPDYKLIKYEINDQ